MAILFLIVISSGQCFTVYTEFLWFRAIQYSPVFWTMLFAKFFILCIFALAFLILFWINIYKTGIQRYRFFIVIHSVIDLGGFEKCGSSKYCGIEEVSGRCFK